MIDITFRNMTEQEFAQYSTGAVADYAEILVKVDHATEDNASEYASAMFAAVLPGGFYTEGASFYVIVNSKNEEVGTTCFKERQSGVALIMDIMTKEQFRRQGYGRKALALIEEELISRGFKAIVLNVFEYNTGAKALYESCGYAVLEANQGAIAMMKNL